jgi:hypothetical protein
MQFPTWLSHRESCTIKVWLCEIVIKTNEQTHSLHVGPKLNNKLEMVQSARYIAEQFVSNSPLFLIDDQHHVIPVNQIIQVSFQDHPAQRQYTRMRICKWFKTSWKKVDTQLI